LDLKFVDVNPDLKIFIVMFLNREQDTYRLNPLKLDEKLF